MAYTYITSLSAHLITLDMYVQEGKVNVQPFNNRRFRDCFKLSRNYKQTNQMP